MKKYWIIIAILILAGVLRVPFLDKYPSGLNADEAAIGYNAYSLIQTGKDEHGASWPLVFRSFDDYKPPLYVYLTLPFVKLLGLNIWAVRLPSAILGVLSVFIVFLLVRQLFPSKKYLPEISSLLLAISPWHLHFSRGGWEVNASTFLLLLGTYFFIKAISDSRFLYLFGLSFALSLYTYHSARIIAPLLAFSLFLIYFKDIVIKKNFTNIILSIFLGLTISLPIASQLLSKEGQSRFSGVSIFADTGTLSWVHEMRRIDPNPDSIVTKIKYNKYSAYFGKYVQNYFSHFSPQFLYISGDKIDRSRIPGFGQMLSFTAPFALIGIAVLLLSKSKSKYILIFWLLISPLAAALTYQSPHALRSENMVIPLSIISAYGLYISVTSLLRSKTIFYFLTICLSAAIIYQFSNYLYSYYYLYPRELPVAWQYGFDQIAQYAGDNYDKYDKFIISDRYDQPYILMAFFLKYPPQVLQRELVMTPRDKFGFSTVRQFGKFEFRAINFGEDRKIPNALILEAGEGVDEKQVVYTIYDPAGKQMYRFAESDK